MTLEENKNIVRKFIKALETGDLAQIEALITDDFKFWLTPTTVSSGTFDKKEWLQLISNIFDEISAPITLHLGEFTAEENRVSVIATGIQPLKSGKVYNNHYHLLFHLMNGKISAAKEYSDTYHFGEIFGFPSERL